MVEPSRIFPISRSCRRSDPPQPLRAPRAPPIARSSRSSPPRRGWSSSTRRHSTLSPTRRCCSTTPAIARDRRGPVGRQNTRDHVRRARTILNRHMVEPVGIVVTGLHDTSRYGYGAYRGQDRDWTRTRGRSPRKGPRRAVAGLRRRRCSRGGCAADGSTGAKSSSRRSPRPSLLPP